MREPNAYNDDAESAATASNKKLPLSTWYPFDLNDIKKFTVVSLPRIAFRKLRRRVIIQFDW